MASNSDRRSGSSARSTERKRVHVGTGTRSRKATESHHLPLEVDGSQRATSGSARQGAKKPGSKSQKGTPARSGAAKGGRVQRQLSRESQLKRDERELRRAEARRTRRRRLLIGGVTAVAIASAWLALYTSQLFAIRSVEVTGTDLLVPASVEASASVPADATLLRLPADEIQARLRANPWIESVDLERRFPSTLRIVVTERVPYALVDTGSAFWSVDANGRVLGQAALDTTSGALVVIRDLQGFVPEPGSMSDADGLTNALAVLQGIDPALAGLVRGVSAPTVDETVVITAGSIEIMIGEAVQLQEKSALVTSIMAEQGQSVVFIDVRSIERPISRGLGE